MIKSLLFDVDGVLTSGGPLRVRLEEDYGISQEISASFFRARFRECLAGHLDTREELTWHLPRWGWPHSVDDFFSYWFARVSVLNEPLLAFVQQVRQTGIPCYVATNQEKYRTVYLLEHLGFAHTFDGLFSSAQIGCLKDDVAFFENVLSALGQREPHELLFWDDLVVHVATARKIGLKAELFTDFLDFNSKMQKYLP